MASQLAEHDGYFSCNLLALDLSCETDLLYPGTWEETMISDLHRARRVLDCPPPGWDEISYTKWRDSFGVSQEVWNNKDFGATDSRWEGKPVEFVVGPMLTFEAACPSGYFVRESEIKHILREMFNTMFGGIRKQVGNGPVNCNGKPVEISAAIQLSSLSVRERVQQVERQIGSERAQKLCDLLCYSSS